MNTQEIGIEAGEKQDQSKNLDFRSNSLDFFTIDLCDEETFAPEILTAEDVRELLGIPRADRWTVEG